MGTVRYHGTAPQSAFFSRCSEATATVFARCRTKGPPENVHAAYGIGRNRPSEVTIRPGIRPTGTLRLTKGCERLRRERECWPAVSVHERSIAHDRALNGRSELLALVVHWGLQICMRVPLAGDVCRFAQPRRGAERRPARVDGGERRADGYPQSPRDVSAARASPLG